MLVAAMVTIGLICMVGSAAAVAAEAAIGTAAVATGAVVFIFSAMVLSGVVAYIATSHKKGHTKPRSESLIKALNAGVLMVMTEVNARYAFTNIARATSPQMISRANRTYAYDA